MSIGDVCIILPVFVDDMTFAFKSLSAIEDIISQLCQHFKPVTTPMDPGLRLSRLQCSQTTEESSQMHSFYQLLMSCWRTDVPGHIYQARHCLCCGCSGTLQCQSWFGPLECSQASISLSQGHCPLCIDLCPWPPFLCQRLFTTFSDADHGGCKDSGHSTSAYVVKMGTGVISWSSKLQGLVAQATTEAEYIAAVEAGKEIVWLCNLLEKMGFFVSSPSILHTDNQSAIQVAKNPEHHGCMKHLDLRWFWLRDVLDQGVISPVCPHNWDACWLVDQAIGSSQGATVLQDAWTSPIRGELGYQRCAIMGESSCCTWATSNGRPPQAPASLLCPLHIAHNCH